MTALLLIDIQNDFLPGGALAVPGGDQVIPVANRLSARFDVVVATQDWHPPRHGSFASSHPGRKPFEMIDLNGLPQTLWPDHCVQRTPGAAFAPALDVSRVARVFQKGVDPGLDSYSGFYDNGRRRDTGLGDWLRQAGVTRLILVGLATDYCVKYTALDARRLGFETVIVRGGVRGVELKPGDCALAMDELLAAGVALEEEPSGLRADL